MTSLLSRIDRPQDLHALSEDELQTVAQDEVNRCLRDLVDRGDIVLIRVETNAQIRSRLIVAVTYINRRLDPESPKTIPFAFT